MVYYGAGPDERKATRDLLVNRVSAELVGAEGREHDLEILLNDAVHQELERLKKEPASGENDALKKFWRRIGGAFPQVDHAERVSMLREIVGLYAEEIHGSFNPRLHSLATSVVPWFLKLLLSRSRPADLLAQAGKRLNLEENLVISGPLEALRALAPRATLIMVPNHVSNLDSLVIGLGLWLSRLPPFTYGAGLNLFSNPVISYFMNNLGAYKVDRRKKNTVYKTTLKAYASLSMEKGQHNLFFPGGTRNRRGDIERHLKLGLLGCGLPVYIDHLNAGSPKPDLFVVPATLSYGLVLEAKSLISEHLREEGKSRFIREKRETPRLIKMIRFWKNLQNLDSRLHLRFGEPMDLFGNRVNADGVSLDRHGRPIDRSKYVLKNGRPAQDKGRDQEYTRELGRAIGDSLLRLNTALATHAAAHALFGTLQAVHPGLDLFRLIRLHGPQNAVPRSEVLARLERLLTALRRAESEGRLALEPELRNAETEAVWHRAYRHFQSYHDGDVMRELPAANKKAPGAAEVPSVYSDDVKLLYYYRNRLDHYGFPDA